MARASRRSAHFRNASSLAILFRRYVAVHGGIMDGAFSGTLPDRIRHVRRLKELTQAKLAKAIGVAASAVGQWELPSGTSPTVEHLIALAQVSDVAFEWLATGRGACHLLATETPAVELGSMAANQIEDRLLRAFRRVPVRKRETLVRWMEDFF